MKGVAQSLMLTSYWYVLFMFDHVDILKIYIDMQAPVAADSTESTPTTKGMYHICLVY